MAKPDKQERILHKKLVQVGYNTLVDDRATSVIVTKVQCLRTLLVDINRCMACPYNKGLVNQHIMACIRKPGLDLPEVITGTEDPDYPEEPKKEEKKEADT